MEFETNFLFTLNYKKILVEENNKLWAQKKNDLIYFLLNLIKTVYIIYI